MSTKAAKALVVPEDAPTYDREIRVKLHDEDGNPLALTGALGVSAPTSRSSSDFGNGTDWPHFPLRTDVPNFVSLKIDLGASGSSGNVWLAKRNEADTAWIISDKLAGLDRLGRTGRVIESFSFLLPAGYAYQLQYDDNFVGISSILEQPIEII